MSYLCREGDRKIKTGVGSTDVRECV